MRPALRVGFSQKTVFTFRNYITLHHVTYLKLSRWSSLRGHSDHDINLKVESGGKVLWLMIVLASLAVATIFLHASIQDFTSSTVVTTIATTTASLSEVYFPSVILCSINQIRKSLFTVSQILTGSFLDFIFRVWKSTELKTSGSCCRPSTLVGPST